MGDMKDKVKGFMKKVNDQLSSSSSSAKFKGQSRVLGSSSSESGNFANYRSDRNPDSNLRKPKPPVSYATSEPLPEKPLDSDENKSLVANNSYPDAKPINGFDPFDSLITSGKRSQNGYSINVYECPICGKSYGSEEEVSMHVDSCVNTSVENSGVNGASELPHNGAEAYVGAFLSAKPTESSIEVLLKLARNIVREPENSKFRRIRMSNPKIREAVGEVAGGIELLEFVGFELREENEDMWAVMEVPTEERIMLINKVIALLEPRKQESEQKYADSPSMASAPADEPIRPKKVDRQTRVFFSVPESVAEKIEIPDSFYNISFQELKREADLRKKKMADSQLLIPKSYKEKQANAGRRRYTKTIIRVQFPDGVVLQAVFSPWESTSALYEFVRSALKEPGLEFELLHPVLVKRRVIPQFPVGAAKKAITLEEEDLVPSALIKFKPIETDSIVFSGLCNELLEVIEPFGNGSARPA